jgi:hypothetical protein
MPRRIYYRRQADLCLQLALVQNDPHTTLLLAALAKELVAKADDADSTPRRSVAAFLGRSAAPPERVEDACKRAYGGALQTRDRSGL